VISGPKLLQAAALEAARQWTYKPYLLNGTPTEIQTQLTFKF
jgi:protein TonB